MKRPASQVAALALALGLLVGDSLPAQEPESVALTPGHSSRPVHHGEFDYPVPYADSPLPARVRIPSVDIVGDIQPVGMSDDTTMQVPADIDVVGWFDNSVLPIAESGHTVLVGHRDGSEDPDGVFRNLGDVRIGDGITVRDLSGRRIEYSVTSVDTMSDERFAARAHHIFRKHGVHRLILITCGGSYDAARGGYQANVVVVATRT
jgi:LPXTG-site transpeptidase (sortase) family protein